MSAVWQFFLAVPAVELAFDLSGRSTPATDYLEGVGIAIVGIVLLRLTRQWPFKGSAGWHDAIVCEIPRKGGWYFVAKCSCGWWSKIEETSGAAFERAHRHTTSVDRDVQPRAPHPVCPDVR
jgi:hypothetical protein